MVWTRRPSWRRSRARPHREAGAQRLTPPLPGGGRRLLCRLQASGDRRSDRRRQAGAHCRTATDASSAADPGASVRRPRHRALPAESAGRPREPSALPQTVQSRLGPSYGAAVEGAGRNGRAGPWRGAEHRPNAAAGAGCSAPASAAGPRTARPCAGWSSARRGVAAARGMAAFMVLRAMGGLLRPQRACISVLALLGRRHILVVTELARG